MEGIKCTATDWRSAQPKAGAKLLASVFFDLLNSQQQKNGTRGTVGLELILAILINALFQFSVEKA